MGTGCTVSVMLTLSPVSFSSYFCHVTVQAYIFSDFKFHGCKMAVFSVIWNPIEKCLKLQPC